MPEGHYIYIGYTSKGNESRKFWYLDKIDENTYEACWGKMGHAPLGWKTYTYEEAVKVASQKVAKGYERT